MMSLGRALFEQVKSRAAKPAKPAKQQSQKTGKNSAKNKTKK